MIENFSNRTKHVAIRVSPQDYERLAALAKRDLKPLREWCRDRILDAARVNNPSPCQHAILGEIAATQAIMIDLIYTWAHDGKLSQKAVQDIVSAAQNSKFKEACQLFSVARSRLEGGGITATPEAKPGETF